MSGATSAIWDTPTDPIERARARVVADQEYLDAGDRQHRARSRRAHVSAASPAAASCCGRPTSRFATATSTARRDSSFARSGSSGARCCSPSSASCSPARRGRWAEAAAARAAAHLRDRRAPAAALRSASSLPVEAAVLVLAASARHRARRVTASYCAASFGRYLPWNRRFMNASMSVFHSWFCSAPSAIDVVGDLHAEQHVVVHAVVQEQPVPAERQQVRHRVHALEHRNQVVLEVELVDRIRGRDVGDVIVLDLDSR